MSWQAWSAGLIVVADVAYLVWKVGFSTRRPRKKAGPDVPVSRLVRRPKR